MPEDDRDPWIAYSGLEENGFLLNPDTGKPYSYRHLLVLMRRGEAPLAAQFSPGRVGWRRSWLQKHDATRPIARSLRKDTDAA